MATNQQRREAAKRKLERQLVRRAERAKRRKIVGAGVVGGVVLIVAGLVVWIVNSGGSGDQAAATPPSSSNPPMPTVKNIPAERAAMPARPKALPNPTTCSYPEDKTGQAPAKKPPVPDGKNVSSSGTVTVTMKTTQGDIPITLDRALAPCTVQSFVSLAKAGFYTDTICHRLGVDDQLQMLQCGDPNAKGDVSQDGRGGPGYTVPDEVVDTTKYGRGLLAMANTGQPNSGGSQFFMLYGNAQLQPQYTVFGSIADSGLQVLDKIAKAGLGSVGQDGVTGEPKEPVKFTSVTVS
ncbi:peptidyl-prolyl cis-trans isomerase B (cyclophilin B) [Amycolatopsis sulphurea]|uniref:Peptidyl-prolyl cis-trans isomerase B (Cyclophilin B) n=1 Tax=Amycolatopsis sulphurea TaxID=76022 RepID=A0A2A9G006_9PSEU|nr:peptidylprolyl isomerase [Amycolatopsis sulphurea]PFG57057.1 peptidyl-prolyl cis-trans isomerase B (cyclophilin B) [Amycolatopsis sulphurea]